MACSRAPVGKPQAHRQCLGSHHAAPWFCLPSSGNRQLRDPLISRWAKWLPLEGSNAGPGLLEAHCAGRPAITPMVVHWLLSESC